MDKTTAEKLLPLINQPHFEEDIRVYVNYRVSQLHKVLEQAGTIDAVKAAQGAITELRKLVTLRDEVNVRSKD